MSISYYYDQAARIEREISDIHRKIADETKKEVEKQRQIASVSHSVSSSTSISTIQSKQRQINGYNSDIVNIQKKKADLHKKLADKTTELSRKKQEISNEEIKERKKIQLDQENFQRRMERGMYSQRTLLSNFLLENSVSQNEVDFEQKSFDFFISHASEDNEDFVRPLAEALIAAGFRVWYDEHQLKVGDSLRRKIDDGLKRSKFGIVVLSLDFFKKNWPEYELNGLVAREMNGVKVILPIWHKVSKDDVLSFSPTLADKVALNTTMYSKDDIVSELKKMFD